MWISLFVWLQPNSFDKKAPFKLTESSPFLGSGLLNILGKKEQPKWLHLRFAATNLLLLIQEMMIYFLSILVVVLHESHVISRRCWDSKIDAYMEFQVFQMI